MTTRKPASLDGSLLARKGTAVPAVPLNSPLTEELGEPRPRATVVRFDVPSPPGAPADAVPAANRPPAGRIAAVLIAAAAVAGLLFAMVKFLPTPDRAAGDGAKGPVVTTAAGRPAEERSGTATGAPAASRASAVDPVRFAGGSPHPPAPIALAPAVSPRVAESEPAKSPRTPAVKTKPAAPVAVGKRDSAAAPATSSPYLLQLASVPSPAAARTEAARLQKRLGALLGRNRIVTVRAVGADRQTVYRLRVGGYASLSAARDACTRIRQQKIDCLAVRR